MKTEEILNNIIKTIQNMCNNANIVNHVKRLIKENKEELIEIKEKYLKAEKYGEIVEINISDNSFTIYSTSWNSTNRKKISFFKDKDNMLLTFDNNEVTDDGIIFQNYKYEFKQNNLICFSYSKKVNLEYELGREIKKIKKDINIDIYPIDNNDAIKIINESGNTNYFFTHIKKIRIEDISLFSIIYSKMDSKVDYKNFQKCLR